MPEAGERFRPRGFRALVPDQTWQRLLQSGIAREFSPGEPILVRGAPAGSILMLLSGRVEVGCHADTGDYRLLALRGADDIIGEVASQVDGRRTADVFAIEPCSAVAVTDATFRRVLVNDGVHDQLSRYVATKLQHAGHDSVDMMSLEPIRRIARLMVNMIDLADDETMIDCVPMSQTRVGQVLGLSRSLVARLVGQMRADSVLGPGPQLAVADLGGLRRLAAPG